MTFKIYKASGLSAKMIKHFGDKALSWLLALFNNCALKAYKCLILTHISPTVEEHPSGDQSGFRVVRSCCVQVLNVTQYTKDGCEQGEITVAVQT